MPRRVLFIQGAGQGAHKADAKIVENLQHILGPDYEVVFPAMPNEADADYDAWKRTIENELAKTQEPTMLVAHSVGASILLKCLSEIAIRTRVSGIFLMAAPFWGGNGWLYDGYKNLELTNDIASALPPGVPVFLYHCRDDTIVPYEHLALYARLLPHANKCGLDEGGHQFSSGVSLVAKHIVAVPRQ